MSGRLRLVQVVALADIGMVRVAWSASWCEYRVRATGPAGQVAEYFTDDRTDALGTADAMLAQLAAAAGMPA
jgi:hypothetical protein